MTLQSASKTIVDSVALAISSSACFSQLFFFFILNSIPKPVWITSNEQLLEYCEQWQAQDFIALDTEFVRTSTFFPKAGLVQVADAHDCYLIDPLTITDWSSFAALLDDQSVVKVFHACSEDFEVCHCLTGTIPSPVADTQLKPNRFSARLFTQ